MDGLLGLLSVLLQDVLLPTGILMLTVFVVICSTYDAPVKYHLTVVSILKRLGGYNFFVRQAVKKAQCGQPCFRVFSHGRRINSKNYGNFADGFCLMVWFAFPVRMEDVNSNLNGRIHVFNHHTGVTYFDQSDGDAQRKIAVQNNFRYILKLLQQEHYSKEIAVCVVKDGFVDIGINDEKICAETLKNQLKVSSEFAKILLNDESLFVQRHA